MSDNFTQAYLSNTFFILRANSSFTEASNRVSTTE
jgi:hypothetical protein